MNGPGPLFILSSARSGSTLFRILLDTHPEIYSPPELDLGRLARHLTSSIAWLEGTHDRPPAENPAVVLRTRAILGDLLDSYAQRRGKPIWCEKSPDNANFGDLLAEVFPDARFLCLYRHALDVAHSCIETYRYGFPRGFQEYLQKSPGDHVQAVLEYWLETTTRTTELERRLPERTFRLRYEDLVADPAGTLAPLFGFLGLAWDPALLATAFTAEHDRGPGDPYVYFTDRIRQNSVGTGGNLPVENLPVGLKDRVQARLTELGYPARPVALAGSAISTVSTASAAVPGTEGAFEARQLFERLPAQAAGGPPPPAPLACDVVVHGPGGGAWALEWDADGLRVTPGPGGLPSRIELEAADLLAIVSGQANPLKIVQEGRIRVEGVESEAALRGLLQLVWAPPTAP
ncbi:MAG TPA: sulfotransferase [Thermoanaerobaculia bacterium]|nr:sulfotransferase [Thermoanaerobaculia bacterium]